MNSARLARKWREAGGDFGRMAEDLSDEMNVNLATKEDLNLLRIELKSEMEALRADFATHRAEVRSDVANGEARLMRTLILTQITGFVALAVLILLR